MSSAGWSPGFGHERLVHAARRGRQQRRHRQAGRTRPRQPSRRDQTGRRAGQAARGAGRVAVIAVLVTRPGGESDPLVQALRQRGYLVHAVPTVQTEAVVLDLRSFASYDWVVVTSARGVDALAELPAGPRFAVVGTETAKALRARGVEPAHVPATPDGAS